ncbi:MAG: LacI family transcriptional regulator [Leptolinea sp.]|jgi:DNA-binding LacI/PurR family transcriptional regulator|nr:LacI family transcriptional regulator [Leptolinea sp.]
MQTVKRAVTLKDVAQLAGVSTGIASMALSDDPRVAAATKANVLRAAEKLDYIPNMVGRALRSKRLGSIAVIIPQTSQHVFSHPYFIEVLKGVTDVANAHNLTLILSTSSANQEEEAYMKILRSRRADGVIVASASIADPNIARLASSGYPVVFLGRDRHDERVISVTVDDIGGAVQAVTHLIEKHKLHSIAHLTGPLGHRSAADKLEGYRLALGRHGLPFDERLVVEGDYSQESGIRACRELLDRGQPVEAIFAANDEMTIGALQVLEERGLQVPRDLALIGYDDISLSAAVRPSLTTVHQPMEEVGRRAAQCLIELLDEKTTEPRQVELPTELVIRKSCGC